MSRGRREQTVIVGGLATIGFLLTASSVLSGQSWSGVWLNAGTGLVGSVVTYLLFDRLLGLRERSQERRESLIRDLNSTESAIRRRALEEMAARNWLTGADLRMCNLSGLSLRDLDLSGANLSGSNMFGADLTGAVLRRAIARGADFRGAQMVGANLEEVNFEDCDLRGAFVRDANARGAVFANAKLDGVDVSGLRGALLGDVSPERLMLDGSSSEPRPNRE